MSDSDKQGDQEVSAVNSRAADERAIGPLITFLRGHDVELRRTAAVALGRYNDTPVVEALAGAATADWDVGVRCGAVEALGQVGGEAAVAPLVKALADRSEAVRDAAVAALEGVGPPAVPGLISALGHQGLMMRRGAALALGRIADERAVAPLVGALQGVDFEAILCRWAAAEALGEVAARRPTPLLRDALPPLRQAGDSADGLYRRVIRQIEAATAGVRHLPVPAPAPPPPRPAALPVPAGAAESGEGGTVGPRRGDTLRRVLRRWLTPRLTTGEE